MNPIWRAYFSKGLVSTINQKAKGLYSIKSFWGEHVRREFNDWLPCLPCWELTYPLACLVLLSRWFSLSKGRIWKMFPAKYIHPKVNAKDCNYSIKSYFFCIQERGLICVFGEVMWSLMIYIGFLVKIHLISYYGNSVQIPSLYNWLSKFQFCSPFPRGFCCFPDK